MPQGLRAVNTLAVPRGSGSSEGGVGHAACASRGQDVAGQHSPAPHSCAAAGILPVANCAAPSGASQDLCWNTGHS